MDRDRDECALRAMHRALDGRHPTDVAAYLDDASLLHVAGESGLAGDYQGREAIVGLLTRMAELTGDSSRCGAAESSGEPGGAVTLRGPIHAARRDRTLDTVVTVRAMVDGNTLREVWVSHQDQRAFDELWA